MQYSAFALGILLVSSLAAQSEPEHFLVQYQGGDSREKKQMDGYIVLTDSAVEFHKCATYSCVGKKDGLMYLAAAQLVMRYAKLTEISGATDRQFPIVGGHPSAGTNEIVSIAYDSDVTAEAPVFWTQHNESAQLIAKIKFHLRKLKLLPSGAPIIRDTVP